MQIIYALYVDGRYAWSSPSFAEVAEAAYERIHSMDHEDAIFAADIPITVGGRVYEIRREAAVERHSPYLAAE
jgi:hypothetical protein